MPSPNSPFPPPPPISADVSVTQDDKSVIITYNFSNSLTAKMIYSQITGKLKKGEGVTLAINSAHKRMPG